MELRPYQVDAIERVRQAMAQGHRRVILVCPTGSGKTVMASEIVRRAIARGRRALWLAHRSELIEQAAQTLSRLGLQVGALCAAANVPQDPDAPVQVASVQTLLARDVRPPADIIIGDEFHHYGDTAETWQSFLSAYPEAYVVGPTATPARGDGSGLRGCADTIVVGATVKQLTAEGHLVPCHVLRPAQPLKAGELAQGPVEAYMQHAPGRRAIVFCKSVPLADEYAAAFVARGQPAKALSVTTPWRQRCEAIDAFRRGDLRVLTNVYILTEGFDAPATDCCILARGCGSASMYLQAIGRVLRPAPGKRDAVVLDLRGTSHFHGLPEDEREYSLEGGIRVRDKNAYCPVCGAPKSGQPCGCGHASEGQGEMVPDVIRDVALVPYARKRSESSDARFATLLRWASEAHRRGYKPGYVFHKWKSVYGEVLDSDEYQRAMQSIRGEVTDHGE